MNRYLCSIMWCCTHVAVMMSMDSNTVEMKQVRRKNSFIKKDDGTVMALHNLTAETFKKLPIHTESRHDFTQKHIASEQYEKFLENYSKRQDNQKTIVKKSVLSEALHLLVCTDYGETLKTGMLINTSHILYVQEKDTNEIEVFPAQLIFSRLFSPHKDRDGMQVMFDEKTERLSFPIGIEVKEKFEGDRFVYKHLVILDKLSKETLQQLCLLFLKYFTFTYDACSPKKDSLEVCCTAPFKGSVPMSIKKSDFESPDLLVNCITNKPVLSAQIQLKQIPHYTEWLAHFKDDTKIKISIDYGDNFSGW